ncbi:MAG: LysM peptidoglycan-binding domain-containing protein [Anaerolineaceae bacterium]|nr:LysM peptidoglycan-binding domain-containing protein [Anaerolineaceae bacterium]
MKKKYFNAIFALILTACQVNGSKISSSSKKLMPYVTQTEDSANILTIPAEEEPTALPQPTPKPVVHVVTLGETISSIALLYGVTIDAVLTANPNIKPTVLIVGDEILIPKDGKSQALATDPALLENISLLGANCAPMEDGLWCAMMVNNHGSYDLENGVVKLSIRDGNGEIIEERSVPTVMRLIRQGASTPAVIFLDEIPKNQWYVTAEMLSASQLDIGISPFLPVTVIEENYAINGLEATISGRMRVEARDERDRADISIGAAAFDSKGMIIGVRRLDSAVKIGDVFNFSITVYSASIEIDNVILYAESY